MKFFILSSSSCLASKGGRTSETPLNRLDKSDMDPELSIDSFICLLNEVVAALLPTVKMDIID